MRYSKVYASVYTVEGVVKHIGVFESLDAASADAMDTLEESIRESSEPFEPDAVDALKNRLIKELSTTIDAWDVRICVEPCLLYKK